MTQITTDGTSDRQDLPNTSLSGNHCHHRSQRIATSLAAILVLLHLVFTYLGTANEYWYTKGDGVGVQANVAKSVPLACSCTPDSWSSTQFYMQLLDNDHNGTCGSFHIPEHRTQSILYMQLFNVTLIMDEAKNWKAVYSIIRITKAQWQ